MAETFEGYFEKRKSAIENFLLQVKSADEPQYFHDLRVEIKKLKTLFKTLNAMNKGFRYRKWFEPFRTIFQIAGKVRELQLAIQALENSNEGQDLNNYISNLTIENTRKKEEFKKAVLAVEPFIIRNFEHALSFVRDTDKTKIELRIEKQRKDIKVGFESISSNDNSGLHDWRKKLKEFYYLSRSIDNAAEEETIQKTDAYQELIGQWHDLQVLRERLEKSFKYAESEKTEKRALKEINQKLLRHSKSLLKDISEQRNLVIQYFS